MLSWDYLTHNSSFMISKRKNKNYNISRPQKSEHCRKFSLSLILQRINCLLNHLQPFTVLACRLWLANIFFFAGLAKIKSWNSTIFLFQYEYNIPLIPVKLAAFLATSIELICPIMLIIGLGSRLSAAILLCLTAIIEITYIHNQEHIYWAMLLLIIIAFGPGRLAFDHWLKEYYAKLG